jgi:hypothetical protein
MSSVVAPSSPSTTNDPSKSSHSSNNTNSNNTNNTNSSDTLILKAPQQKDIIFFNENGFASQLFSFFTSGSNSNNNINSTPNSSASGSNLNPVLQESKNLNLNKNNNNNNNSTSNIQLNSRLLSPIKKLNRAKKKVKFPEDDRIIHGYSDPPKVGWTPGLYPTSDLLDSYIKSCERHKSKPLNKLLPQLKALQDLDCANGEKVNVLNLKSERLDSRQMDSLEEIFKRLSFKTIDLESTQFDDDPAPINLFEILMYYDTCEKLILANARPIALYGWQELGKYIRKVRFFSIKIYSLRCKYYGVRFELLFDIKPIYIGPDLYSLNFNYYFCF